MKIQTIASMLVIGLLAGCHDDKNNGNGNGPGTVSGLVMDINTGVGIAGATVAVGAKNATTDGRGYFTLDGLDSGVVTLSVSKSGYAPGFATPKVGDAGAPALVTLKKEGAQRSYDPNEAATLSETTEAGPYAVIFEAGALDTSDANLTVSITPVDPTKEASVLPGELSTSGSTILFPVTFGEFTIRDSSGKRVQLKSGSSAIVELPIPPQMRSQYALGAKIHCYAFNTAIGSWDDFVDGTVRLSSVDGTTPVLAASIKHFSWYGGAPEGTNCVDVYGTVVSAVDGKPLGNARVEASPGGTTYTDANGNFKVVAGTGGSTKFFAYQTGYDVDGSLTGIAGAKYIEYGEVTEELTGLVLKECSGSASAAAAPAGTLGGQDNPVKVTVGNIGKEANEVFALLSDGGAQVSLTAGLPNESGELQDSHPVSGATVKLTGNGSVITLAELAPDTGYYFASDPALAPGRTYQIAIDVDGNGSVDGQGTASIVGDLAVVTPQESASYPAASASFSWTDSGATVGDPGYTAVYFATIQSTSSSVQATGTYIGTARSFSLSALSNVIVFSGGTFTVGGTLPAGEYTFDLVGYSGFAAGATGSVSQSNNITGVGISGTAYSAAQGGTSVTFTLE